jgi:hypothetical protein
MLGIELDSRSRAVFTVQREQGSNAIITHNCTRGRLRLDGRAVDGLKRAANAAEEFDHAAVDTLADQHLDQLGAHIDEPGAQRGAKIICFRGRLGLHHPTWLRRQERLGQPLDPSSTILLVREDARHSTRDRSLECR